MSALSGMFPSMELSPDQIDRLRAAAEELEARYADERLEDNDADAELHNWIDGPDEPLDWTNPDQVTSDEWFFITTLYGTRTMPVQRTYIRKLYPPLFVFAGGRDVRGFGPDMPEYDGLYQNWMAPRLAKMGKILRDRGITMDQYTEGLRQLEKSATPERISPGLDAIIRDHQATGWKTLSVFVRDCVKGNVFSIDSRVEKELRRHALPADETLLIRLSLAIGRNPRKLARMFYTAGGDAAEGG